MICPLCREVRKNMYSTTFNSVLNNDTERFTEIVICRMCQENNGSLNNNRYIIIEKDDYEYYSFPISYLFNGLNDHNQFSKLIKRGE